MEVFFMYFWLQLPIFIAVLGILTFIFTVLYLFSFIKNSERRPIVSLEEFLKSEDYERRKAYSSLSDLEMYDHYAPKHHVTVPIFKLPFKRFYLIPVVLFALFVFIPNQTQTAVLVGTSIAVDVAKSPEGQKIGALLRAKANELLDAELRKLQPQPPVKKD